MNIVQFVAAEIIILLVISSVEKLLLGLETFYDVLTSLEKIGQVSDKDLENLTGTVLSDHEPLKVELSQFTYAVPDRPDPILNNINVLVESKDVVLVEGNNNSGKSTLLKALAAILEPTSGQLYINDLAFSGIKISSYRAMVGQVLSDETPFEGSILHNLTFGDPNIPLTKVNEVVKVLGLTNFIKEQPAGLYTIIYPEGKRISNTNIKKLLLARAILKQPKLLLLKDPLEYFNTTEAQQIIDYLVQPNHTWAIVIVSQNNIWKKH